VASSLQPLLKKSQKQAKKLLKLQKRSNQKIKAQTKVNFQAKRN